jgi:cyclase
MFYRFAVLAWTGASLTLATTLNAEVGKAQEPSPGVWFHEGDLARRGHCNNGWVVFKDYVLVIDANFPSGALDVLPKIRATSDRPIRFAFDTHHHGDHAYGNKVFSDLGATIVSHEGVLAEMKRFETGYYGGKPGRWEDTAKGREDMKKSELNPPTLLFGRELDFEDATHRVELRHFGVAHTRGDGFAWLPKERILFTGDACVNGPYNYMGDGDSGAWVQTLEAARELKPLVICPGHGLMGGPEVLDHQIEFIKTLRAEVKTAADRGAGPGAVKAAVDEIKAKIQKNERIANYVGPMFGSQVEKAYIDQGGKPFESAFQLAPEARKRLAEVAAHRSDRFGAFNEPVRP